MIWIDAERQYSSLVDALGQKAFDFAYPVIAFRGSYLKLMLALEPYGNGLYPEQEKVLVHLPGLNKETVKETPVFEAGQRRARVRRESIRIRASR